MEVTGQLHAPAAFSPEEEQPTPHSTGGWVSPTAGSGSHGESSLTPGVESRLSCNYNCLVHSKSLRNAGTRVQGVAFQEDNILRHEMCLLSRTSRVLNVIQNKLQE
jgi:hypothetical protein